MLQVIQSSNGLNGRGDRMTYNDVQEDALVRTGHFSAVTSIGADINDG